MAQVLVVFLVFLALMLKNPQVAMGIYRAVRLWLPLDDAYRQALARYNTFYQRLPPASKKRFERKVKEFILHKKFIPRKIPRVTKEMKAMIASAAVQLTFGLPDVTLLHFDKILVYPDSYYSVINKQYHKGEVNPRLKAIVVSWKAFVEGFARPHDGINLGLHEMAHALKLENIIRNGEHHFFNLDEYKKWLQLAKEEMAKINRGEASIFRSYAGVDEDEFFAVCMELYFEQPHQLYDYNEALYKTLSNLLHQDTIRLFGPAPQATRTPPAAGQG